MILVDGHCYQARGDGSVTEVSDDTLTPFATVVAFSPDETVSLSDIGSFDDLTARLDGLDPRRGLRRTVQARCDDEQQGLVIGAVGRVDRDADRGRDEQVFAVNVKRLGLVKGIKQEELAFLAER